MIDPDSSLGLVGYRVNISAGRRVDEVSIGGTAVYNYVMAGNGLFLESENHLFKARIPLAAGQVRGLQNLEVGLSLAHGKIPRSLLKVAVVLMRQSFDVEMYIPIVWDGISYQLANVPQQGSPGRVAYTKAPNTVVELHSHQRMPAFFSSTDDADEQGLGIFGVVGRCHERDPEVRLRLGIYGYFMDLSVAHVFEEEDPDVLL